MLCVGMVIPGLSLQPNAVCWHGDTRAKPRA